MKIAFLGMGVMGFPMAGHLQKKFNNVRVYNRTLEKANLWQKRYKGQAFKTIQETVEMCDVVVACVGNDEDIKQVTLGEQGAFYHMKKGALFIDHTTTSVKAAKFLQKEALNHQINFMDAPVSGGEQGAQKGILTIMAGAQKDDFKKAQALMSAYAKTMVHIGGVSCGQYAKMVNQICIAGLLQGLAEGLSFAQKAQLDIPKVIEAISKGAAGSWQMDNRWQTMIEGEFNHGFALDWMQKDLGYCLDEARKIEAQLPITKQVNEKYQLLSEKGDGRLDTSALIKLLK